jgi:hypothetical protein
VAHVEQVELLALVQLRAPALQCAIAVHALQVSAVGEALSTR